MMTYSKTKEYGWLEAKQSGGAVFEQGVKESKRNKAIRRIAEPLMEKHWKDSVSNLHRVYKVAEYLYNSCLLYTSPSPRDRTRSRMPSSA